MRKLIAALFLFCLFIGCESAPTTKRSPRPSPDTPVWIECPECKGSGWKCADGVCKKCTRCDGSGKVIAPKPAPQPDDEDQGKRRRHRRPRR